MLCVEISYKTTCVLFLKTEYFIKLLNMKSADTKGSASAKPVFSNIQEDAYFLSLGSFQRLNHFAYYICECVWNIAIQISILNE